MHHRRPEERKHAITKKICDRAAIALDSVARDGELTVQEVERLLGLMLRGHGSVAAHVGKERRHVTPVTAERHCIRISQHFGGDASLTYPSQQVREPVLQ